MTLRLTSQQTEKIQKIKNQNPETSIKQEIHTTPNDSKLKQPTNGNSKKRQQTVNSKIRKIKINIQGKP